jgi:hypothetical protein
MRSAREKSAGKNRSCFNLTDEGPPRAAKRYTKGPLILGFGQLCHIA